MSSYIVESSFFQKDQNEGALYKLRVRTQEVKPHTVGKIHMGKNNDDKWTVFEASMQTHLYYKTVDESGEEKTELLGSYIVGKVV